MYHFKKRFPVLFLSILLILSMENRFCMAESFGLGEEYFVSEVRWYAGTPQENTPLAALVKDVTYPTVTAVVEVQALESARISNVTALGVVQNENVLVSVVTDTQAAKESAIFTLTFTDVNPVSLTYCLKVYVWGDIMTAQQPVGHVQTLKTEHTYVNKVQQDMELIRQRLIRTYNLYSTSANPQEYLDKLDSTGRFSDLDYNSTSHTTWDTSIALTRATTMLQAYYSQGNSWYGNERLKDAIDLVLQDWADYRYKSTNWWYQEIDVPKKLVRILFYPLENEPYLPVLRELALLGMPTVDESLPHLSTDIGANLMDKLIVAVAIAAATRDTVSMKNVVTRLLDHELSIFSSVNGGEGIMTDGSFHQHASLLYNGSYGSVFCNNVNTLLGYLEDTSFMVSDRALNIYTDFILDGHSLMFYNNMSDFSCFGRAVSRQEGVGNSIKNNCRNAVNILLRLPGIDRRSELLSLRKNRLGDTDSGAGISKHFWLSDFTVHHLGTAYVSVRNSSNRNKNTEYLNNENKKAYYIADGATPVIRTGNEYKNIFPVWNWSRIPGTTTAYLPFEEIPAPAAEYGATQFVGGVSNGKGAVTVMDYSHNAVTARKANFLFTTGFTALGTAINGTGIQNVTTTLNQCIQNGNAYYSTKDGIGTAVTGQTLQLTGAQWVWHDRIGYFFPKAVDAVLSLQTRTGTWNAINSSQSTDTVQKNIYTLYLDHGLQPREDSYCYTVLPDIDRSELADYVRAPDMTVLTNSKTSQAVWSARDQSAGFVFWNDQSMNYQESVILPGSVTGLRRDFTVTAKNPCAALLAKTENGWNLSVSNPKNDDLAQITIEFNIPLFGRETIRNSDGSTQVTVPLPQGEERGKSVTIFLTDAPEETDTKK